MLACEDLNMFDLFFFMYSSLLECILVANILGWFIYCGGRFYLLQDALLFAQTNLCACVVDLTLNLHGCYYVMILALVSD